MAKRALLSVSDKTGIVDFAKELVSLGFEIVSTGGTKRALAEAGVAVTQCKRDYRLSGVSRWARKNAASEDSCRNFGDACK